MKTLWTYVLISCWVLTQTMKGNVWVVFDIFGSNLAIFVVGEKLGALKTQYILSYEILNAYCLKKIKAFVTFKQ